VYLNAVYLNAVCLMPCAWCRVPERRVPDAVCLNAVCLMPCA
jgi:hypothetical protein